MPTLRSREVIFMSPLEEAPPGHSTPTAASTSTAVTPRRSLRIAGSAPAAAPYSSGEKVGGKRKAAARVSRTTGSMKLRSGTKIARRSVNGEEAAEAERVSEEELFSVAWPAEPPAMEGKGEEMANAENLGLEPALDREVNSLESVGDVTPIKDEKGKGKQVMDQTPEVSDEEKEEEADDEMFMNWTNVEIPERIRSKRWSTPQSPESRKAAVRNRAIDLAPKFALFKAANDRDDDDEDDEEEEERGREARSWPGPFSTAMELIQEWEEKRRARELNPTLKKDETAPEDNVCWVPSVLHKDKSFGKPAPSLRDLCLKVLCDNAEEIESLEGVPDLIRNRLMAMLCRSRKIGPQIFTNLVSGFPTEIRMSDCSWATEEQFQGVLGGCNTDKLKVVQLDLCGRCMPDYVLRGSLAQSPNCLPSLTSIYLKGNYRLTDDGISAIVASAPSLSAINISQCSLITSDAIIALADKLETGLRELYIDHCQNLDPMLILPALIKLKALEVLSMSGVENVSNKFVRKLVSECGSNFKVLSFADCRKLTAASMKAIGEKCPRLCALDLSNLNRLTDPAIGHLGNGCRSIQKLKLRRNKFSDEAVAAFVESAGDSLTELSVNNVEKVAKHTALAIARQCRSTLNSLDLSFCREMTNEALGLIVDSCWKLRTLKLFGCSQITNVFREGHSNSLVKVIGLKGSILDQLETPYVM